MKKFFDAELVELNVQDTAFGIYNPELPDIEKDQVDGSILDPTKADKEGYRGFFGRNNQYEGQ